jgi:hypothetical protein
MRGEEKWVTCTTHPGYYLDSLAIEIPGKEVIEI